MLSTTDTPNPYLPGKAQIYCFFTAFFAILRVFHSCCLTPITNFLSACVYFVKHANNVWVCEVGGGDVGRGRGGGGGGCMCVLDMNLDWPYWIRENPPHSPCTLQQDWDDSILRNFKFLRHGNVLISSHF